MDWFAHGATIPLTGFGYTLGKGVIKGITDEIDEKEPPRDENTIRQETRKEENNNTEIGHINYLHNF